MKTKEEIDEYKECIELAKIEVKDFLLIHKGNYYTAKQIANITGVSLDIIDIALLRYLAMPFMHGIKKELIKEDGIPVYYYGWE